MSPRKGDQGPTDQERLDYLGKMKDDIALLQATIDHINKIVIEVETRTLSGMGQKQKCSYIHRGRMPRPDFLRIVK